MDIVALEFIKAMMKVDSKNDYFVFVKPDEDKCLNLRNFEVIELAGKTYVDWEQISLPRAVKKYDIDLLHCTSNTAPMNPGVPLVLLLHDVIYLEKNPLFNLRPHGIKNWGICIGNGMFLMRLKEVIRLPLFPITREKTLVFIFQI